jgi:hypothetical protein
MVLDKESLIALENGTSYVIIFSTSQSRSNYFTSLNKIFILNRILIFDLTGLQS